MATNHDVIHASGSSNRTRRNSSQVSSSSSRSTMDNISDGDDASQVNKNTDKSSMATNHDDIHASGSSNRQRRNSSDVSSSSRSSNNSMDNIYDGDDATYAIVKTENQGIIQALFCTFTISLAIVLQVVRLVSEHAFSKDTVHLCQIALILFSFVCMALLCYLTDMNTGSGSNNTDTALGRILKPLNMKYIVLCLLAVGSMVTYIVNAVMMVKCVHLQYELEILIQLLSSIVSILFIFIQVLFIGKFKNLLTRSTSNGILFAIPIATNLFIAIGSLFSFDGKVLANNTNSTAYTNNTTSIFDDNSNYAQCRHELQSNWAKTFDALTRTVYTFILGFGIYSICFYCQVWIKSTSDAAIDRLSPVSINDDTGDDFSTHGNAIHRLFTNIKRSFWILIKYAVCHAIAFSSVLCIGAFLLYMASCIQNNVYWTTEELQQETSEKSSLQLVSSYVMSTYYYLVSVIAFYGMILVISQKVRLKNFTADDMLLLIGLFGHMVLILCQTTSNWVDLTLYTGDSKIKISFTFKLIFHFLGISCQAYIILKYSGQRQVTFSTTNRRLLIKAVVVFLGISNVEIWVRDSLLPPIALEYLSTVKEDVLGVKIWWYIIRSVMPFVAFYRIQSALMCYDIVRNCFRE